MGKKPFRLGYIFLFTYFTRLVPPCGIVEPFLALHSSQLWVKTIFVYFATTAPIAVNLKNYVYFPPFNQSHWTKVERIDSREMGWDALTALWYYISNNCMWAHLFTYDHVLTWLDDFGVRSNWTSIVEMNNWIGPTVKHEWNNAMHVLRNFLGFDINTTAFHLGQ